ncbi:helix-turn-helix transcriptional regulator [Pseudohongiella sp. SYSU M77423]|uniref:helix-turn-helix domain-containing protein n=1 Tax=Pseudohongiella sp. SYSU M77423 TaxID=3042312 RepID=UPI00247FE4FD|nr:helix-turn-helix transcriptional regulator [Pseudohongiella sp. SYSU M77423]MDH7943463.1 helix-turn-helix transcriptional regulator [Pseudohongiella sp. SYSU M77423]
MPTSLGSKIKELRDEKGYTLEKLADLTESSKSYIWELENKTPPRPSAEKLSRIAAHLGVTIEYLLDTDSGITKESAEDALFYRKYKSMDEKTKDMLKAMVNKWTESND